MENTDTDTTVYNLRLHDLGGFIGISIENWTEDKMIYTKRFVSKDDALDVYHDFIDCKPLPTDSDDGEWFSPRLDFIAEVQRIGDDVLGWCELSDDPRFPFGEPKYESRWNWEDC